MYQMKNQMKMLLKVQIVLLYVSKINISWVFKHQGHTVMLNIIVQHLLETF